jgi:glycosyltransferase involved in cell wall biosynthesis
MKNQNKFVILITAYNDEKWVEYNIASLLNQTYSNYKVLYYDDASTDNTYKLASEITQDNNKFVITTRKKNMQALFSYEECIKQIKEDEILICLSGDDWLLK